MWWGIDSYRWTVKNWASFDSFEAKEKQLRVKMLRVQDFQSLSMGAETMLGLSFQGDNPNYSPKILHHSPPPPPPPKKHQTNVIAFWGEFTKNSLDYPLNLTSFWGKISTRSPVVPEGRRIEQTNESRPAVNQTIAIKLKFKAENTSKKWQTKNQVLQEYRFNISKKNVENSTKYTLIRPYLQLGNEGTVHLF